MILSDAGNMIERWCFEIENKFPDIKMHEFVTMPNHWHGIIQITNPNPVGVDLRVYPKPRTTHSDSESTQKKQEHNSQLGQGSLEEQEGDLSFGEGVSLSKVVQWFKTMTTNEYIRNVKNNHWTPFNKRLWQRNYHEHIIRDEQSYIRISEYIQNNPIKWQEDRFCELLGRF